MYFLAFDTDGYGTADILFESHGILLNPFLKEKWPNLLQQFTVQ